MNNLDEKYHIQEKICRKNFHVLGREWLFIVNLSLHHFCRLILLIDKAMICMKTFVIERKPMKTVKVSPAKVFPNMVILIHRMGLLYLTDHGSADYGSMVHMICMFNCNRTMILLGYTIVTHCNFIATL